MGFKHWAVTVACWLFLGGVACLFLWYCLSTLWTCIAAVCNDSDASAVGGVLGVVLLLGVPALLRRMRR